jgi:hypothetical protein
LSTFLFKQNFSLNNKYNLWLIILALIQFIY